MPNKTIHITKDGKIQDSDRRVPASKKAKDTITFTALTPHGPWAIKFKGAGSPFAELEPYAVPKGPNNPSSPLTPVAANGTYPYMVLDANGNITDDPDVIIVT